MAAGLKQIKRTGRTSLIQIEELKLHGSQQRILHSMSINKLRHIIQFALLCSFTVLGLSFNHVSLVAASGAAMTMANMPMHMSMPGPMSGHGTSSVQCQGICNLGVIKEKQDGLPFVERNVEEPKPAAYWLTYQVLSLVLFLVALRFVVKILALQSSWRPPDLVKLHGQLLLYA